MYRTGRASRTATCASSRPSPGYLAHGLEIHRHRRTLEAENSGSAPTPRVADDLIGDSDAINHLRQQIPQAPAAVHRAHQGRERLGQGTRRAGPAPQQPRGPTGRSSSSTAPPSRPTLLEAELFGYKKGAFSGADRDHPGLFQQADEGTLFLDEVGELSLDCQAKLLRVIEGKAFRPVGGTPDVKVDVRIVAATHRDLEKEVKAGRFRQDLLFRLKVIPDPRAAAARAPRGHPRSWPGSSCEGVGRVPAELQAHPAAMRRLQAYSWPGNVRQLRAVIESAAVMSENGHDRRRRICRWRDDRRTSRAAAAMADLPPSLDMDEIETWAIRRA